MDLNAEDFILLLHPAIAVTIVFPLIGMVIRMAWQTRQRRLEVKAGSKSKIPPAVGQEHVQLGRWLTGAVVGIYLLGITYPIIEKIITDGVFTKEPSKVALIGLFYIATIASLVLLYRAQEKVWRGVFATLTGIGLVVLGFQDGVYRLDKAWFASHFYYGLVAALLMVFSLAIVRDIYQDQANRWRTTHVVLNCVALLLFVGQGITGTRDLLEIPTSWQKSTIYQCNFDKASPGYKTCPPLAPPK
ncbi:MAG: DUF4079 domain-containing protein [Tildeniella nuda ZEHNDER 1965/U140]|jgi:hypothetical protein|nr:DUF4079 domain-containing protein [Tildeniella nuda ZEHNDER 1965/U140]